MKTLKEKPEYAAAIKETEPNPKLLDTFTTPELCAEVALICDEVTSLCPITKQPDFSTVKIHYYPRTHCVETKSLKEYLFTFRNYGTFCEAMSTKIAEDLYRVLDPYRIKVTVEFKSRGGIVINATSTIGRSNND